MTGRPFDKYQKCGAYHWDALAPSLRTHNAITAGRYQQVLAVARPVAGRIVLDVGCGDVKLAAMLAEAGVRLVVGVDNEWTGFVAGRDRIARELPHTARQRIALARGDGFRLPVRAESCDLVVMNDIIEHVTDALGFIREAATTLKDDGQLVITTPYRATERPLDEHHVHEYYPDELKALLEQLFSQVRIILSDPLWVVELYTRGGVARPFRWFVNALSILTGTSPMLTWPVGRYAGQITAVAQGRRVRPAATNPATRRVEGAVVGRRD